MAEGIYLKNRTANTITYTAPDKEFSLTVRPKGETGDTQYIPEKYIDDMGIRRLVTKKICSVVTGKEAVKDDEKQYKEAQKAREVRKAEVLQNVDKSHEDELLRVQCSAVTGAGTQCTRQVTVKVKDTKDGKSIVPVFCRQHAPVE